jgi:hypothetical protein
MAGTCRVRCCPIRSASRFITPQRVERHATLSRSFETRALKGASSNTKKTPPHRATLESLLTRMHMRPSQLLRETGTNAELGLRRVTEDNRSSCCDAQSILPVADVSPWPEADREHSVQCRLSRRTSRLKDLMVLARGTIPPRKCAPFHVPICPSRNLMCQFLLPEKGRIR